MIRSKAAPVLLAVLAALPLAYAQMPASTGRTDAADAAAPRDAAVMPRRSARAAAAGDPRVCLEFPTNLQVIACAEKYRPDRRRAVDS